MESVYGYAERKIKTEEFSFPKPYKDDDLFIMGGDFVVRQDGKVVYAFHQTTPIRPAAQDILSRLKEQ